MIDQANANDGSGVHRAIRPAEHASDSQTLDGLANRVLDLEAEGRLREAADLIRTVAAREPRFVRRVADLRGVVGELGAGIVVPDATRGVLARVAAERPFTLRRRRLRVSGVRVALAAGVLVTLSLAMFLERTRPGALRVATSAPAPVGRLADASRLDAGDAARSIASAVEAIGPGIAARARREAVPALSFGDAAKYEGTEVWSTGLQLALSSGPSRRPVSGEPSLFGPSAGTLAFGPLVERVDASRGRFKPLRPTPPALLPESIATASVRRVTPPVDARSTAAVLRHWLDFDAFEEELRRRLPEETSGIVPPASRPLQRY